MLQSRPMEQARRIVGEKDLWMVGFHIHSLDAINWVSGLVDVLDVFWVPEKEAVILVVRNLDKTGLLFNGGELHGSPIDTFQPVDQGLMVDWSNANVMRR